MLRRGFKSQCERRSVEIRKSFSLTADEPLSAFDLATELNIFVWNESEVAGVSADDICQLCITDSESWSAFTIRVEGHHLIVYNSAQTVPRQNSVVMHEMAHIILGHELTSAALTDGGHFVPTTYNQDQEDEADWLAGTLLLPRPSLLKIRRQNVSDIMAMKIYMVSQQMLTWRFRMTGVDFQISNAKYRNRK